MSKHQSYYMVIPAEVWDAPLTARAMILYGHISVLANKKKYCYANNKYFEKVMKSSNSSIARAMKELEDNNLISRELIYKDNSKQIEERKIFLTTGIINNDNRPVVTGDNRPVVTGDADNSTSNNNTSINNKKYKKVFQYLLEKYPKHRINAHGPIEKYLKKRTEDELLLILKNLNRYLDAVGDFTHSLRNYLELECWTEEWLSAKNKSKINNIKPDTKTFNGNYDNV